MSEKIGQELSQKEERIMEYVPFGASDKIKLSISIIKNIVAVKTKSGKTCSDSDAIRFMMLCQARKLSVFEGDAFLIGYDGKDGPTFSLITAHQAFLKRAELNAEFDGMKSGVIVEEDGSLKELEGDFFYKGQKVVGGWATVFFKTRKYPIHRRIRLERFKKNFGVWLDDEAGMIVKCTEADALRSSFPTMLGGLYLKEELNPEKDIKNSMPIFSVPQKDEAPAIEAVVVPEIPVVPPTVPVPSKPTVNKPAAPPSIKLRMDAIRSSVESNGVTLEQIIAFFVEKGLINENTQTLEEIAIESPDTLEMIETQMEDIATEIKNQ